MSIFNRRANVMSQNCNPRGIGSTSWWQRVEVDSGMEVFLVAPPHTAFPSAKGRQDPETTIVGTFCKVPEGQWSELVEEGAILVEEAHSACCRKKRRQKADVPRRTQGFPETEKTHRRDAVQSSSLELDLVCLPFSSGQSAIRFQAPGLIAVGQRLAPLSKARTFLSRAKLSSIFLPYIAREGARQPQ